MAAFLLPNLGQKLQSFIGIHPRFLSYGAVGLAMILAHRDKCREVTQPTGGLIGAMFIALATLVFVEIPPGTDWVFFGDDPTPAEYPSYKLTRFVLLSIPLALVGAWVRDLVVRPGFCDGAAIAAIAIGVIAGLQIVLYRELLIDDGSYRAWKQFSEEARYSTISLSLVLLYAIFGASHIALQVGRRFVPVYLALVVPALLGIVLLAQRTPLFIAFGAIPLVLYRLFGRRVSGVAALAGGVIALWVLQRGLFDRWGHTFQLERYAAFLQDESTSARLDMWTTGLREASDAPLGHGLGSFAREFPEYMYPHNFAIEMLYELGYLGAAIAIVTMWLALVITIRLMRTEATLILLGLLAIVFHVMKAGDLTGVGALFLWLHLGHGGRPRAQLVPRQSSSPPLHRRKEAGRPLRDSSARP